MRNQKISLLACTLVLAVTAVMAAQVQAQVKIGHVGPITGPISYLGKDSENGARMAVDELNASSVSIGGKKIKIELVAEDDAADPKQGTAAAQKLVDEKVNGVVGHFTSGTTIPASKIYSDAGIPQVSPGATNPKYTQQGFKTAFRVVANDGQLGSALGRYAVKNNNAKSVAVIDDRTAYGQGIADEFIKSLKEKSPDVQILAREFTNDRATDFSAILTKIKPKKPDVIFFGGTDAVAGPLLRQMKQLGISAKFMGGDSICTDRLPDLAGDAITDGQVTCAEAGGVDGAQIKVLEDFRGAYKKRFGTDAQVAQYSYDATKALVAAMVKAGSPDPEKYLPVLAANQFKGVTGTIAFDGKGDIKDGAVTVYTYKGGKRVQIAVVR
jgi:branched-chain amino acid transport system substrate-binding protein